MAGTNDIAENQGAITLEEVASNIEKMVEKSIENKINCALCSVPPATDFYWAKHITEVPKKVSKLNEKIKKICEKYKIVYLDYHSSSLSTQLDTLDPLYTSDGVHPNLDGYLVMEPILENLLKQLI